MSEKSASLYVRMKPETKEKAENILNSLGVSPSTAINMFYEQIILQKGIPFEVKLPPKELFPDLLSDKELAEILHKGYEEATEESSIPFDEWVAERKEKYHVHKKD